MPPTVVIRASMCWAMNDGMSLGCANDRKLSDRTVGGKAEAEATAFVMHYVHLGMVCHQ